MCWCGRCGRWDTHPSSAGWDPPEWVSHLLRQSGCPICSVKSGCPICSVIKGLLEAPGCTVAYPESQFLSRLESVVREADARGNLIFDAQIAALCREQGIGTIVTNDRDFARFGPLQVSYLSAGT